MRRTFSYCAAEKYLASRLALILAWPLRSFRRRAELPPPSGHRWEAAAARRVDGASWEAAAARRVDGASFQRPAQVKNLECSWTSRILKSPWGLRIFEYSAAA